MSATLLRTAPVLLLTLGLPGLASAQKDEIVWRDGTTTEGAKVTEFNAKEIKFRAGGSDQSKPAHFVRSLTVEKWEDVMKPLNNNPGNFITEAREKAGKDDFTAQALYYRAAELFDQANDPSSMLAALQEMFDKNPRSGYAPDYFRRKVLFYLQKDKPQLKDATEITKKYAEAGRVNAWDRAFELDAELWQHRIASVEKGANVDTYISTLKELISRAAGVAEFVVTDATVELADAYRAKKSFDEARTEYDKLMKKKGLDDTALARAYVGLGYIDLEEAIASKDPGKTKEAYHAAMINFLKVYTNCKQADATIVAEGLYNAANACEQWGELPTCKRMAGLLRGRLKYREPYKFTHWAKK